MMHIVSAECPDRSCTNSPVSSQEAPERPPIEMQNRWTAAAIRRRSTGSSYIIRSAIIVTAWIASLAIGLRLFGLL